MTARVVRPATPEDRAALHSLYSAAVARADWLPESARIDADLASVTKDELILVCSAPTSGVLGFASLYVPDRFVHHLFVAPGHEGMGIGTELLASLPRFVPPPWRLKCLIANSRALAFYARRAWIEIGRDDGPEGPYALLEKHEA